MSALKSYSDIVCLVKNEVESIRKREGELPPTAYIVMEVANRLKTLTPWDGYDKGIPLAQNLRGVVDELVKGKFNVNKPGKPDPDMEVIWISPSPYESLEDCLGDKRRVGQSVDRCPTATKKEKLKKKLKQAS